MLKINSSKTGTKYNGTVVVNDEMTSKIDQSFDSKFKAFCFGIENNWTKQSIMKYCLDTTRDQYFYNYYNKYLGSKK